MAANWRSHAMRPTLTYLNALVRVLRPQPSPFQSNRFNLFPHMLRCNFPSASMLKSQTARRFRAYCGRKCYTTLACLQCFVLIAILHYFLLCWPADQQGRTWHMVLEGQLVEMDHILFMAHGMQVASSLRISDQPTSNSYTNHFPTIYL